MFLREIFTPLWLLVAQVDEKTLDKLKPDTVTPVKISALLAFLGLFVLLIGSVLLLWLFSRYVRRNYYGEPEPFVPSKFSEFSYKYRDHFDAPAGNDDDDDQLGLLPRREER